MKLELYVEPKRLEPLTKVEPTIKKPKFKPGDKVRTTSGPYDPVRCCDLGIVSTVIVQRTASCIGESGCTEVCELNVPFGIQSTWYTDCLELVESC